ncbi:MAG TPA: PD-(D/E)XK nuclease-like domain-containing protein [Burkholderiales bacterium]|nr:PD-(D/E)XK nuclease-like domain-containing protein [Burkholderiales bacterium]
MTLDAPVRFSHLKAYGRSAAHGLHARTCDTDPNYAMQRGTAVHAILFDTRDVLAWDGPVRRGKAFDDFVAQNPNAEIMTSTEYAKSHAIASAVRACKPAMEVLQGEVEKTIYFDWMGSKCRATPDVRGDGYVTELKTSATSDPNRFVWHALRMQYNAQLRMQQIACNMDILDSRAYIVAVESAAPFPVTVFNVQYNALEVGERNLILWMERLRMSESSESWPAYVESIVPLDMPEDTELTYEED